MGCTMNHGLAKIHFGIVLLVFVVFSKEVTAAMSVKVSAEHVHRTKSSISVIAPLQLRAMHEVQAKRLKALLLSKKIDPELFYESMNSLAKK